MDKIRLYGISLFAIFISSLLFSYLSNDDMIDFISRLVFIAWFTVPILMIILGGNSK